MDRRLIVLALIGLVNALPMPMMGNMLSIWLTESGYSLEMIALFSLFALPLSFKLLWAPVVDYISPPFFEQRKGWMFISLLAMAIAFFGLAFTNPETSPWQLAVWLVILALATGCMYIAGIAYELESIDESQYAMGSAYVTLGYRCGLLCAGAGGLYLSAIWNWSFMFQMMAFLLIICSIVIYLMPEPYKSFQIIQEKRRKLTSHQNLWQGFWKESFLQPCQSFFSNPNWLWMIFFILSFKIGDELIRYLTGPFYLSLGFDKIDIANAEKIWGLAASISGTFLMALFLKGKDPFDYAPKIAMLHAFSLFCYVVISFLGRSYICLYTTIALENLTGGMAMTAFITVLWRVCDRSHAATQYVLFWTLFLFKGRLFSSLGALLAMHNSWSMFYLIVLATAITTSFLGGFLFSRPYSIKAS